MMQDSMSDIKTDRKDLIGTNFVLSIKQHSNAFWQSIFRLSVAPIASIITFIMIGVTLALPMSLYVLIINLQKLMVNTPTNGAEISLYLKIDTNKNEINNLIDALRDKSYNIKRITYISKKTGLKNFEAYLGISNVSHELEHNPLPPVLILQPQEKFSSQNEFNVLLNKLKSLPKVESVQLDMQWLARLQAIINLCHRLLYTIIFLFAIAVLLIIGNTIKLIMQKYKTEINIQKLLGATNNFIRRPFLYGGAIYGLIGSIIAWLLVDILIDFIQAPSQQLASLYDKAFNLQSLTLGSTALLLLFGIFIGYLGALFATYKEIQHSDILT